MQVTFFFVRFAAGVCLAVASTAAHASCMGTSLHDLSGGTFVLDSAAINEGSPAGTPVKFVIPVFAIEHPKGLVLFDTGVSVSVLEQGCVAYFGEDQCRSASPDVTRDDMVDRQLERIGRTTSDVTHIVYSHFHADHVGNLEMFPHAKHVVQRAELQTAWQPQEKLAEGYILADYAGGRDFQYIELSGDFDLFGDRCVEVLSTPGHTPGHQSLLVRLPRTGTVILSGDTMYSPEHLTGTTAPALSDNMRDNLASNERLRRIRDVEGGAIWITHDLEQHRTRKDAGRFD